LAEAEKDYLEHYILEVRKQKASTLNILQQKASTLNFFHFGCHLWRHFRYH